MIPINCRILLVAGALAAGALTGVPAPARAQAQPVTLDFVDARLADVIRSLAASLGINVVLSGVPERRITFSTSVPVPPEETGGVLESILEANQLVLVQKGAIAQVMPADSAPPTGPIRTGTTLGAPPLVGLVTQLVPLRSIRADEAAAALRQVMGPRARVEAVARSNALLITDMSGNVARYLELLSRLDERPQGEAGLRTYVVPLRFASAEDLAASLSQLFGITVGGSRAPSLSDLSLSRNLDVFREREAESFRLRPAPPPAALADTAGDTGPGALVGRTTIVPDLPSNSLMIRTAPPNFPLLRETIEALDTRPRQVLFEVTVIEINLGRGEEFGIDWSVLEEHATVRLGAPLPLDSLAPARDFAARFVNLDRLNVRAALRALATRSRVRVLSTPEILASNNREARIVVGNRIPFVASARLGDLAVDRSVQYEDVGTTLTLIPTISQDDYVNVQLLQEVNSLTNRVIGAALDAPVISTREAFTRAVIRDGQTVVIGGLIGDSRDYLDSGVPYLKDIPLIGLLFRRQSVARTRTELAIFVTPHIIRSDAEAEAVRRRIQERMNTQMPGSVPDPGRPEAR